MESPTAQIETLLPHRPPMLLIDTIVEQDEGRIVATRTFHRDEFFVQGHFPGHPIVPGVVLCECALQAGAALVGSLTSPPEATTADKRLPVVTRIDGVKFKQQVHPGQTVVIEARLTERLSDAFFLTGKISLDGKLAARLDFACTFVRAEVSTEDEHRGSG
ncbi:MAG: beta-hydroxyacyl-ACP dehydratase [Pirellulaceae bacterium]|nr:MAG: beta-hydroxyacyl-ACP dehydratase [Pirellulaceae bacterium]